MAGTVGQHKNEAQGRLNPFPSVPVKPSLPCPHEASLLPQSPPSSTATEDKSGRGRHAPGTTPDSTHPGPSHTHSCSAWRTERSHPLNSTRWAWTGASAATLLRTATTGKNSTACLSTVHLPDVLIQWKLHSRKWDKLLLCLTAHREVISVMVNGKGQIQ